MAAIQMLNLTANDLTEEQNKAKDITLDALVADGLLSQAQADEWGATHVIITHENNWFGKFWTKLRGENPPGAFAISMLRTERINRNDKPSK